ncbi:MAG: erythromycin esterase family protein [Candidatus Accumulibacter sp.]|uniref:erythromycin esterase family protein n=1 Tax=Accumulibacter sp. TaxID=2053492 RepID=UPI0028785C59|nr:erythromycin esterase family protein [Accumulibacter sp.]MDS4012834.1 erythromycin esterase family protein [Accumulibacter sp.]
MTTTEPRAIWRRALPALLALLALTRVAAAQPLASDGEVVAALRAHAIPVVQAAADYDVLLASIGDAQVVMLGEATHGSAEFYDERARLTQRLITEKGFRALILEAGWASATRLDDFVQGKLGDLPPAEAFSRMQSFPRWVWRNREFAAFLARLKAINDAAPAGEPRVSIHGMDLYGVPEAVAEVVHHLQRRDPAEARRARRDYRCFAPYSRAQLDPQLYGRDLARAAIPSCARQVERRRAAMERRAEGDPAAFSAMMSARSLVAAEAYYRLLYSEGALVSWNSRERFLAQTLRRLRERHGKVVVWAHNTHQGDARASAQADVGELSLGQLMREEYGEDAYLVGLTTYRGSVRAATGWATPDRRRTLRPAVAGSWSHLLQQTGMANFLLIFRQNEELIDQLDVRRLDRAVGVSYLPEAEIENHYSLSLPARRFDALIHLGVTQAVTPLP